MNTGKYRPGATYLYTGGEATERVKFKHEEINKYTFERADGSLLQLCVSNARVYIRRLQ